MITTEFSKNTIFQIRTDNDVHVADIEKSEMLGREDFFTVSFYTNSIQMNYGGRRSTFEEALAIVEEKASRLCMVCADKGYLNYRRNQKQRRCSICGN